MVWQWLSRLMLSIMVCHLDTFTMITTFNVLHITYTIVHDSLSNWIPRFITDWYQYTGPFHKCVFIHSSDLIEITFGCCSFPGHYTTANFMQFHDHIYIYIQKPIFTNTVYANALAMPSTGAMMTTKNHVFSSEFLWLCVILSDPFDWMVLFEMVGNISEISWHSMFSLC